MELSGEREEEKERKREREGEREGERVIERDCVCNRTAIIIPQEATA